MPYAIEGIINLEKLRFSLHEDKQITTILMHEAVAIDPADKNVRATNLKTQEIRSIPYDSLIIASGADPFIPR